MIKRSTNLSVPVSLAGALAGVLVFALTTGFQILQPRNIGWLFNGGVDPSIHFVGWHLFRNGPWTMPPGATANLGYPVGTSVALTDSIPLAAMLLKPFSALLPDVFQYFGLWLLACFVLQGVFGVALIATVTTNRWLQALGGSVFALSPLLVHRMGHAALTAHWILLAGLWLGRLDITPRAVAAREATPHTGLLATTPFARYVGAWVLLAAVAAATHPYIVAMLAALALTALFSLGGGRTSYVLLSRLA